MAEYIKREDVLEFSRIFDDQLWETGGYRNYPTEAVPVEAIMNIPSADVAEVVRCKDCSHSHETSFPSDLRICLTTGCINSENYFCSDGKRMDGGT
jgi:hypothetical protein